MAIRWQMVVSGLSPECALRAVADAYVSGHLSLDGNVDILIRRDENGALRVAVIDETPPERAG